MPLLWGALVLLVGGALVLLVGGALLGGPGWTGLGGLVLLVAGLALYFRGGTVRRPPVEVAAPVAGRWTAVNSPADKVPSHGLHAYGQTYAIDLVHEPADESRPAFGVGPGFRPPEDLPALASRCSPRPTGWSSEPTAASGTIAPQLLAEPAVSVRPGVPA